MSEGAFSCLSLCHNDYCVRGNILALSRTSIVSRSVSANYTLFICLCERDFLLGICTYLNIISVQFTCMDSARIPLESVRGLEYKCLRDVRYTENKSENVD